MTLGSLFDGIGGFPLAAQRCGIIPVWASEIEPAPISITQKQFPNMKHLGSVTDISGAEIEPVDIISFGSPCQDLSVAGKQAGLDGERSGLFMEAVRIIKEMRSKTNGVYPAYAIWENVPGAFSSHGGEDFRRVLEALAETKIPIPKSGKWGGNGVVRTPDRELAWRTVDAQYWGVPQRRKRIYLVVDFRNRCAAEILFKCESLLGYTPQSGEEREAATAAVGGCTKSAGFNGQNSITAAGVDYAQELSPCIRSKAVPNCIQATDPTYCLAGNIVDRSDTAGANGIGVKEDCSYTLNTVDRHAVAFCIGNGQVAQLGLPDKSRTLDCMHDPQAVIYTLNSKQISLNVAEGLANTLAANDFKEPQSVVYSIDRAAFNQGENAKYDFDVNDSGIASTLVARGPSAVCMLNDQGGSSISAESDATVSPTLRAEMHGNIPAVCDAVPLDNVASTLRAGAGAPKHEQDVLGRLCLQRIMDTIWRWIVRRLTPRECERLQGFPDDWTRYGADGKEIKDAPRYKALGNSIAIPCAERVFKGIVAEEARHGRD